MHQTMGGMAGRESKVADFPRPNKDARAEFPSFAGNAIKDDSTAARLLIEKKTPAAVSDQEVNSDSQTENPEGGRAGEANSGSITLGGGARWMAEKKLPDPAVARLESPADAAVRDRDWGRGGWAGPLGEARGGGDQGRGDCEVEETVAAAFGFSGSAGRGRIHPAGNMGAGGPEMTRAGPDGNPGRGPCGFRALRGGPAPSGVFVVPFRICSGRGRFGLSVRFVNLVSCGDELGPLGSGAAVPKTLDPGLTGRHVDWFPFSVKGRKGCRTPHRGPFFGVSSHPGKRCRRGPGSPL